MHGYLLGLCFENEAGNTDDITDIVLAEIGKLLLGHGILADVQLDAAVVILYVAEYCLAHAALGHNAACGLDGLAVESFKICLYLIGICASYKTGLSKGVSPLLLQSLELIASYFQQLAELLIRRCVLIRLILTHSLPS